MTLCPPGPEEQKRSIRRSFSSTSTSTASASGITATVAAEVWIRPAASVAGTLCTRWTPDSYLSREKAPSPSITTTASLIPPSPVSDESVTEVFHRLDSAYRPYMRKSSPAKSAASSPPVPARISRMTLRRSFGSTGNNNTFNRCSIFSSRVDSSAISDSAICRISSSSASATISRAPSSSEAVEL